MIIIPKHCPEALLTGDLGAVAEDGDLSETNAMHARADDLARRLQHARCGLRGRD